MSKIDLSDVNSGYNLLKISSNFAEIERVINEDVLHRKNVGNELPNTLETDIDANGQGIYNLRKPLTGGEPLRLKDLFGNPDDLLQGPDVEIVTTIAGQTVITLATTYVPGSNSHLVFRNGIFLPSNRYVETNTNTITLNEPADAGDEITIVPIAIVAEGSTGGETVDVTNVGTGAGTYKSRVGSTLSFRSIKAGNNVTVTQGTDEVVIDAVAANVTASNLGATGEGVYASKTGDNFNFKKLKAGTNVTLSSDADSITINASGGGGGGSSITVLDNGVSKTTALTSLNFINTTVGAAGGAITVTAPSGVYLNVKDFGATGDGTTNDSTAVQNAINAAKSANRALFFPDGTYAIPTLGTQSGRIFLIGTGRSVIKGSFIYLDATIPPSADTTTPINQTTPYFSADKIHFQSTAVGNYGLSLSTVERPYFMSTFSLSNCNFYGPYGLYVKHMVGFQLNNCEFNNTVRGARYESCTNGIHVSCRWQNQADTATWIGKASDFAGSRAPGGENLKFVNCEWAVCCFGIVADQHYFLTMDGCLVDYCGVPLFLSGSKYSKLVNSFYGASQTPVTTLASVPGFVNPGLAGVALYGRPSGSPLGNSTVGVTAHNCEFINYVSGSINPIVSVDGYINGTYPYSAEHISFNNCLFYHPVSHSATTLLYIKGAGVWNVVNNRFQSYNVSSSLTAAWVVTGSFDGFGHTNDFLQCRQSGAIVGSANERNYGNVVISSTDPGASIGPYGIWIQP